MYGELNQRTWPRTRLFTCVAARSAASAAAASASAAGRFFFGRQRAGAEVGQREVVDAQ